MSDIPKILCVVLDHTEEDGADVVRVVGVFSNGDDIPAVPDGVTRNVVRAFEHATMNQVAFRIHPKPQKKVASHA